MSFERFLEEAAREARERAPARLHPSEDALWAYVGRAPSPERERSRLVAHLSNCLSCDEKAEIFRQQVMQLEIQVQSRLPQPSAPAAVSWLRRLSPGHLVDEVAYWLYPQRLARHALVYATATVVLFSLNALMNAWWPPAPNPLGSPTPPSWWAPWAAAVWGVVLVLHGVAVLMRHRRIRERPKS